MDRTQDPDDRADLDEALGMVPRAVVTERRRNTLADYGDVVIEGEAVADGEPG